MPIPDSIAAFIEAQAKRSPVHTTTCASSSSMERPSARPSRATPTGCSRSRRAIFSTRLACATTRCAPSIARSPRDCGRICASTATTKTTSPRSTARSSSPPTSSYSPAPSGSGDQSSQTRTIIERLYAYSSEVNDAGQWAYYGKVGGVLTTGNEDGGKHVSAQVLYALQHIGLTHPATVRQLLDRGGRPGPLLPRRRKRRTTERLDHAQHGLHDLEHAAFGPHAQGPGGFPAYGNSTHDWNLEQPDHPNPEYR